MNLQMWQMNLTFAQELCYTFEVLQKVIMELARFKKVSLQKTQKTKHFKSMSSAVQTLLCSSLHCMFIVMFAIFWTEVIFKAAFFSG